MLLALVFNLSNLLGFTCVCYEPTDNRYADRDAQRRWSNNLFGGIGGQLMGGVIKNSIGRVLG